ncbi:hypothetical protein HMPREF1988_00088 [Porphyromonas gingivalis F0185]|nr:hypothetical protein HMPREF1988_00088 [Porphyromonas gingivalis F0185]
MKMVYIQIVRQSSKEHIRATKVRFLVFFTSLSHTLSAAYLE